MYHQTPKFVPIADTKLPDSKRGENRKYKRYMCRINEEEKRLYMGHYRFINVIVPVKEVAYKTSVDEGGNGRFGLFDFWGR